MGSKIYYISQPTQTDPLWHVRREGLHAMSFIDEATAVQWATSHARAHASTAQVGCQVLLQGHDGQWRLIAEIGGHDRTPRTPARECE